MSTGQLYPESDDDEIRINDISIQSNSANERFSCFHLVHISNRHLVFNNRNRYYKSVY